MKSVKELDVYKVVVDFTVEVYKITSTFPKEEIYGLVSQMRKAAVSINSNLVEGNMRGTKGEYRHFVGIARGSAAELSYQIEIAHKLKFINKSSYEYLMVTADRICKMLSGLLSSLSEQRTTNNE